MMAVLPDTGPHGRSTRAGGGGVWAVSVWAPGVSSLPAIRADQQATDQERDKRETMEMFLPGIAQLRCVRAGPSGLEGVGDLERTAICNAVWSFRYLSNSSAF